MASINPQALIAKFQYALDNKWGYIYGATHELWSAEKQATYVKKWAGNADRKNSCEYGGKWAGHYVTDCSGLFAWSFKQLGGSIAHGSNSIWNSYCSAKGTLKNGSRADGKPLLPGTAVFTSSGDRHNHIGLYIGNGTVIEAMGAINGVTTTKISNKKWTHWGELKGVSYTTNTNGGGSMSEVVVKKGEAVVTGKQVALRRGPSLKADVITRVPTGKVVQIANTPEDWVYVTYNGESGFMMKEFLQEG